MVIIMSERKKKLPMPMKLLLLYVYIETKEGISVWKESNHKQCDNK